MAARAYRVLRFVSVEMPAGMVPVNALFVNSLTTHPSDANAGETQAWKPQADDGDMAWHGMAARAYRTRSFVNAEMSAGMVPVNALFVKLLIMHPHDAHAEKRKHETKCVPMRTHLRQQAGTRTQLALRTHAKRQCWTLKRPTFRPERWEVG